MPPQLQQAIFYLFAFVSALYVIHLALYLVSANFYDVWQYRRRSARGRLHTKFGQAPNATPTISVVIPAHNEHRVIVRCLNSIRASTFKPLEVLVADDASIDQTRQLVRDYALRHPEMQLRVYRMHQNVGKGAALNTLLRRHVHGELVMMVDADSVLRPNAIANAVAYFADPTIAGVAANVRIIDEPTVLGVLQKFEHMVGYRSKKMYSLFNCEFVVGGVASTYRMNVLRQVNFYDTDTQTEDIGLSIKITGLGNYMHRMIYASDVVAMTEGVATFRALVKQRYRWKYGSLQNLIKYRHLFFSTDARYSRSLTIYRLPMALLSEAVLLITPLAWGYLVYMTLTGYDLSLIIGAYATITAYILLTLWMDEHLSLAGRLRLSVYALISYFIFFIMDLVQLIGILRCLRQAPALIMQRDTSGTWKSPPRSGKKMRHIYET